MTFPIRRHLLLAACASEAPPPVAAAATGPAPAPPPPAKTQPDARIEITNRRLGFIGQVGWGNRTLIHRGRRLPLRVRAAGVGGVGAARIRATGEVFNTPDVSLFPGVDGQARTGIVAKGAQLAGTLWLQNTNGVRIRMTPRRTGLALQMGADGVLIEMR